MANTKSAIKRIKTSAQRHERNQAVKSAARTFVKKARQTIGVSPTEAKQDVVAAIAALDRAARKGVIHANNAARRKSRLVKRYNAAEAALTAEPAITETAPAKPRKRAAASKTKTVAKKSPKAKASAKSDEEPERPKRVTRTRKPKSE